jgi:WD40 repeat protein/ankyrin repeat protein
LIACLYPGIEGDHLKRIRKEARNGSMDVEDALQLAHALTSRAGKPLSTLQVIIFRATWQNQAYKEIADEQNLTIGHIRDTASQLWKLLSTVLGERIDRTNFRAALERKWIKSAEESRATEHSTPREFAETADWGEAPDVSTFYGRTQDLASLTQWVTHDRCRSIAILGIGGVGKTALSVKLAEQIQSNFEYLIWRSLRNAPPLAEILSDLIQFLSNQPQIDVPESLDRKLSRLIACLKEHRCLLILDNVESILNPGESLSGSSRIRAGYYREGYEGYGELLTKIGETPHQSCLILTGREQPKELAFLARTTQSVQSIRLTGLKETDGSQLLKSIHLSGTRNEYSELIERYDGNPLALKIVSTTIQSLFDGHISTFLEQGTTVFGDIRDLLDRQFNRLSELEKAVMVWLAIERESVSLVELREDFVASISNPNLIEALESLSRRCLVETVSRSLIEASLPAMHKQSSIGFTLQNVVMEYMTDRLIEQIIHETRTGQLEYFNNYAPIEASAKDYVRETQERLILKPIADRLLNCFGKEAIDEWANQTLSNLRKQSRFSSGYAAGNILNLLCHWNIDLTGYDFSHLSIWQAYLQGSQLRDTNFSHSDLTRSVFTQSFGSIHAVAFSPGGDLLATGDSEGWIRLFHMEDGQQRLTFQHAQSWWVVSVAFSPDSQMLASGGLDQTVKLWNSRTGECLKIFHGHTKWIWIVAFSPDGQTIASGSDDRTVKLWDIHTGQCLRTLQASDNGGTWAIAFSPDGQTLVSGSDDRTIKFWDVRTGECFKTLLGHTNRVWSVAFSADGRMLASGSLDRTIKLWDVNTEQCLKTLQGHIHGVRSLAFSPDGQTLTSGSLDGTLRLWQVTTGQCSRILQGHAVWVRSVAASPDGQIVASGGDDQATRLWDVRTGKCLKMLQGYTNWLWSVAFSPNGQTLASGSLDKTVRLWDVHTGQCLQTFQGHTHWVWSVVFSTDSQTLASGSDDQTIKLWDIRTGQCLKTLEGHLGGGVWSVAFNSDSQLLVSGGQDGIVRLWNSNTGECIRIMPAHTGWVWSVAFSPDGQTIASSSDDQTVKFWQVSTGQCLRTLQNRNRVTSVAFSPNGQRLASSSADCQIKLWDVLTGQCLHTLPDHGCWVHAVTFSPDGQRLASGSADCQIKLWDVSTGQCSHTLQGHENWVNSVVFSPDGKYLASGSKDGTIKLWNVRTSECFKTLKIPRPYEGMNITGIVGITDAQKTTLKALGATELDRAC